MTKTRTAKATSKPAWAAHGGINAWATATDTEPLGLAVGRMAHIVIGSVIESGIENPSARALLKAVNALDLDAVPTMHPYAIAQQLVVSAALYLRLFKPSDDWRLIAREYQAGKRRFDLVYENPAGEIFVDEIKSGRLDDRLEKQQLKAQVAEELKAGQAEWGERFLGVRTVILGAPRRSAMHRVGGEVERLQWTGSR